MQTFTRRAEDRARRAAAQILDLLERVPPEDLAGSAGVVSGLLDAVRDLGELVQSCRASLDSAVSLLERTQRLYRGAVAARPEKWEPRPGGKVPNGLPNDSRSRLDVPGEG